MLNLVGVGGDFAQVSFEFVVLGSISFKAVPLYDRLKLVTARPSYSGRLLGGGHLI